MGNLVFFVISMSTFFSPAYVYFYMSVRPNDQQLAGIAPKTIKYTRATCAGCASLFSKSRCATFEVLGRVY